MDKVSVSEAGLRRPDAGVLSDDVIPAAGASPWRTSGRSPLGCPCRTRMCARGRRRIRVRLGVAGGRVQAAGLAREG